MTFWAKQEDRSRNIEVHVTYGPIAITVAEEPGHLRSFWGELGKLLDAAENDQPAQV